MIEFKNKNKFYQKVFIQIYIDIYRSFNNKKKIFFIIIKLGLASSFLILILIELKFIGRIQKN